MMKPYKPGFFPDLKTFNLMLPCQGDIDRDGYIPRAIGLRYAQCAVRICGKPGGNSFVLEAPVGWISCFPGLHFFIAFVLWTSMD